jgi:hypothetical protein
MVSSIFLFVTSCLKNGVNLVSKSFQILEIISRARLSLTPTNKRNQVG